MIVFDLECLNGHTFEGWFDDRQDLDNQQEKGILKCPVCETTSVVQVLSPVAIRKSSSSSLDNTTQNVLQDSQGAIAELTEKVAEYVDKNFEDVGSDFTKKALKMHYGAEEYQNIKGTTTKEDDKVLDKEGVPVFRIPTAKKTGDDNLN
jgi:hypothetical protein